MNPARGLPKSSRRADPWTAGESKTYIQAMSSKQAGQVVRVSKWGDGLAVRLPARLVKFLGLTAGDEVEIRVAGPRVLEISKVHRADVLLERLRRLRGRLPADFQFDRLDANERR